MDLVLDGRTVTVWKNEDVTADHLALFVQRFVDGWQHVPTPARAALWRVWRPEEGATFYPEVWIVAGFPEPLQSSGGRPAHATCGDLGGSLYFSAYSMTHHLDEDKFRYVVLHELAHAYRRATGEHLDDGPAEERAVERLARRWLSGSP
jgi:hypothetical protein